ncbi:MAG TPA: TonB-dependent receptor [Candidatus Acidoferrum sp.]|nr:TonB-dependent receptor [Candidatus Acidoferrum sp.]
MNLGNWLVRTIGLVFTLLFVAVATQAQYRAGIQGTVTDPQGAVVSGAKVTVTAKDTGLSQEATTDAGGVYSINRLAPGLYTVTVEKTGFQKKLVDNVDVPAEQVTGLNVSLEVGQVTESVTVNGSEQPIIDTASGTVSGALTTTEIQNLPSVGHDPYQLLRLTPGVFGDGAEGSSGGGQTLPGQNQQGSNPSSSIYMTENQPGIVADGARNNGNSYQIDGVEVNSLTWGGSALITPNEESVKEVQVQANPYDAENGRGAGAQVLVVSQSGTNNYHGSVFIRAHRPGLDAYQRSAGPNLPGPQRDNGRFNSIGGSVGGPAIKNRLFLFFSYETLRENSLNTASGWYVTPQFYQTVAAAAPSNISAEWAKLAGVNASFSAINTGLTTCANAGLTEGTDCATLSGGLDIGSPLTSAAGTPDPTYGQAGTPFGIGNGLDGSPDVFNVNTLNPTQVVATQYNGRADFQATQNDLVTFSIYWTPNDTTDYNGPVRPTNLWHSDRLNYAGTLLWNHTFTPTLINEARAGVTRWWFNEQQSNPQMLFGFPVGNINNVGNVGLVGPAFGPPGPGIFYQTSYNIRDTVTKVMNSHTIRLGTDIYKDQVEDTALWAGLPPSYQFHNLWDWGNDAPFQESGAFDPRTGNPTGVQKYIRSNILAFFVQDDYKLKPNFTLNLGLRWEYFGPIHEKYGNLGVVDLGTSSNTLTGINLKTGVDAYNASHNNWGPQIGFAWSPNNIFGHPFNNRFVLRGGFGIGYTRPQEAITLNGRLNPPVVIQLGNLQQSLGQVVYAASSSPNNILGFPPNPAAVETFGSNGLPTCAPATCGAISLTAFDHNLSTPIVYRYSALGQYDLGNHWVATVGYLGSESRHFFRQINNLNWLYPNNLNPAVAGVDFYTNDSSGHYNAVYFEVQHQFSHTFLIDGQYTYSKCMDHGSQDYYSDPYPFALSAALGPCDYDVTHNFKAYGVWSPRIFRGDHDWREKVLGGWELSGIYEFHTGFPWTAFLNGIQYGTTGDTCSLIYANSNFCQAEPAAYLGHAGSSSSNSAFEGNYGNFPQLASASGVDGTNAYFTMPSFAANGMPSAPGVQRNNFRGPRYQDFDFTLGKDFGLPAMKVLGEGAKLSFRANFYNLFNTLNLAPLGNPQNIASSIQVDPSTGLVTSFTPNPSFGRASNILAARVIEMQARFSF